MLDNPPPHGVRSLSFDAPLGRKIVELHVWAVGEGLRGAAAGPLFEELCRRLVSAGVPVWRAFLGMRTLHPQWAGYGYTWWRDEGVVRPEQFVRGNRYERGVAESAFGKLLRRARAGEPRPRFRARLGGAAAVPEFLPLPELAAAGGTDYFAEVIGFGDGDPARGTGVGLSFATDRPGGFSDDDLTLLEAVLPAVSLALMAQAGHTIAAGLLGAYLGDDAGRRVHQGAVERGSVEAIRAVLWYADIRGFTAIADTAPGTAIVEWLDEVFEMLAAPLRRRGAQILKFLGDGMLAIFPLAGGPEAAICRQALDAAAEAMAAVAALNRARRAADKPASPVDLALHLGEVLYGNVGAVDRLDFTVIGPAVNEVARIEALCQPLGRRVLVSAEFAAALDPDGSLEPLGRHSLRGVREPRAIFGLALAGEDPG